MELETDYLVVGAGAAGMAFTDALLTKADATTTITIIDRRHAPGGHWVDAYPYVRLHQPSTFYGVDSVPLGEDSIDGAGTNAGFYELAGADELRAYYDRVMRRHFLPTGRVRWFPLSDYVFDDDGADHSFVCRLTKRSQRVRVRRKLVDTTYLEGAIPATSPPPFEVAKGARCVAAGEIARAVVLEPSQPPARYVIIGGGKTALDAAAWLLEHRVAPAAIRWVRPRDAWWINRKFQQPRTLTPELYRGAAIQLQAMAEATSMRDLFARLESEGIFLRIDPNVVPTMFRGAVVSESELELLRQIKSENVIRMGHVKRIEKNEIILEHGRVPTDEETVHVHCAASALKRPKLRPIFEPGRVTIQPISWGFACHQFATIGMVEAMLSESESDGGGDAEKNRLCPPISYWDKDEDFVNAYLLTLMGDRVRMSHAAFAAWNKTTRLNPVSGVAACKDDPRVVDARERFKRFGPAAAANLLQLLS